MSFYKYNVDQTDTQLRALIERSASNYQIYKRICELVGAFVVSSEKYFVAEIDEETNFHLVKGLTDKLMTTIIKWRRIEEKEGHAFKSSNLLLQ